MDVIFGTSLLIVVCNALMEDTFPSHSTFHCIPFSVIQNVNLCGDVTDKGQIELVCGVSIC